MSLYKSFPRMCAACALLGLFATAAFAQDTRPRQTNTAVTIDANGSQRLENEPMVISLAPTTDDEEAEPATTAAPRVPRLAGLNLAILNAIEGRLGTPYRMGSEGPFRYDCSGFVWSVFQEVGVNFERGSARHLWSRFAVPTEEEKYKFGTLVFFNHLGHVGIVADEYGFYHASTSRGVVYSPFNEYWSKRVVGFRRVPPAMLEAAAANLSRAADVATR